MELEDICTALHDWERDRSLTEKNLREERDRLSTELALARTELKEMREKYAVPIAQYVDLADRGIIRDSLIRDLLNKLKTGGL